MDIFTFAIRKFRKIITGAPYRYDYFGDHLAVRKKVVPFLEDEKFNSTWEQLCKETNPHWIGGTPDIRWRIHVCIWAAEACMRLEGILQFGVNTGLLSTMIMRNTSLKNLVKTFFIRHI